MSEKVYFRADEAKWECLFQHGANCIGIGR